MIVNAVGHASQTAANDDLASNAARICLFLAPLIFQRVGLGVGWFGGENIDHNAIRI